MTIKKRKNSIIKWVLLGVVGLVVFGGYKYWSKSKQIEAKRTEMQEQRQVMMDFYKDQGLSDEEIVEKMGEMMDERIIDGERKSGFGIMRIMGGGRSPGR